MSIQQRSIQQRIKQLRLPIIQAPMFLISQSDLLIECSQQGIIGTLPSQNARDSVVLDQWLEKIRDRLNHDQLWGINVIVHSSFSRSVEDIEVIVKHQVPIVISALGSPRYLVDKVHQYGGLVFADVTNKRHAEKAIQAGVDGLILIAHGAGGHTGYLSPFAFVNEVRQLFDGLIILGGAISNGTDVLAARTMGADLAYMGTRFIATHEGQARDDYKQMIIDCDSSQVICSDRITGVNANWLAPSLAQLEKESTFSLWAKKSYMWLYKHVLKKYFDMKVSFKQLDSDKVAKRWRDIYSAGQGVGSMDQVYSVQELLAIIEKEYAVAKERLSKY